MAHTLSGQRSSVWVVVMEDPGSPPTSITQPGMVRPPIAQAIRHCYDLERRGEVGLALQQAEEALALAQARAETEALAAALVCLATVRFRLGHYEEARALAEQALVHAAPLSAACADALLIRGNCAAETYSLAEAEVYYHRAAELGREGSFDRVRMRALHGLSQGVYMPRGQFVLALAADEEAYRLAVQAGLPEWTPYPLTTIAWICQITGHYERARATLAALGQVVLPTSLHQGYHHFLAANLALDEGDAWAAPALYAQARSIAEAIGEPGLNVEVRLGLCRYHRAAGDAANALAWAGNALAVRYSYQGVSLAPVAMTRYGPPGSTVAHDETVLNRTGAADSFTLSVSGNDWPTELSLTDTGILPDGGSVDFTVRVDIPASAELGDTDTVTVTATSVLSPTVYTATARLTTVAGVLNVRALIDGRSQLIVQGNTVHWHHLDDAAPGCWEGANEPTYLNGIAWYPIWPDIPDPENRDCDCDSSTYVGVPTLARQDQTVSLTLVIVQK